MIRVIHSAEIRCHTAGVSLSPHSHSEGQLSVVLQGAMTLFAEDAWWLVPAGMAIWLPPKMRHRAHYEEASSLIHVRLSALICERIPSTRGMFAVTGLLRELARECADLCSSEREEPRPEFDLFAELMIRQIVQPGRSFGLLVPRGRDSRLRRATDVMLQNPNRAIGMDELARQVATAPRTLSRLFVTETGMPFRRWREHLRVTTALDMLSRGQSITRTAMALGYSSASSFTTLFTRVLGAPPKRYMRRLNEGSVRSGTTNALPRVNAEGHGVGVDECGREAVSLNT